MPTHHPCEFARDTDFHHGSQDSTRTRTSLYTRICAHLDCTRRWSIGSTHIHLHAPANTCVRFGTTCGRPRTHTCIATHTYLSVLPYFAADTYTNTRVCTHVHTHTHVCALTRAHTYNSIYRLISSKLPRSGTGTTVYTPVGTRRCTYASIGGEIHCLSSRRRGSGHGRLLGPFRDCPLEGCHLDPGSGDCSRNPVLLAYIMEG